MTGSLLAVPSNLSTPKVPEPDQAATSACAKKGLKPREHVQLFRMKQDCNKGFYSEKISLEASIASCFEWTGCLLPRDGLPPFHNSVTRNDVSNKHSRSDPMFEGSNCSLDTGVLSSSAARGGYY